MNPKPEHIIHRGTCDHLTHSQHIEVVKNTRAQKQADEIETRIKLKKLAGDYQAERSALRKAKGLKPRAYSHQKSQIQM